MYFIKMILLIINQTRQITVFVIQRQAAVKTRELRERDTRDEQHKKINVIISGKIHNLLIYQG